MAANIDKSLDDIIKSDRPSGRGRGGARGGRGGRGGAAGRGGRGGNSGENRPRRIENSNPLSRNEQQNNNDGYGPQRRERRGRGAAGAPYAGSRGGFAPRPYAQAAPETANWAHDKFPLVAAADAKAPVANAPANRLEACSSILVSNLDPEVTAEDVKTIFSARGEVVKATVNYDRDGTSLGTAEVVFAKSDDAQKAVEEYDGAEVDGRAMYLKVISTLLPPPPKQFVVTPSQAKIAQAQAQANAAFYGQYQPQPQQQPRAPRNVVPQRGGRGGAAGRGGNVGRGGSGAGGRQQQTDNKPRASSKGPANRQQNGNGNGNGNAKPKQQQQKGGQKGGKKDAPKKEVSAADLDRELDSYHGASKAAAAAAPAAAPAAAAPAPAATTA